MGRASIAARRSIDSLPLGVLLITFVLARVLVTFLSQLVELGAFGERAVWFSGLHGGPSRGCGESRAQVGA